MTYDHGVVSRPPDRHHEFLGRCRGAVASPLMHVVIVGCGRVGSGLARIIEDQGHSVAVVDKDPTAFRPEPRTSFSLRQV